jgi:hypothetical protein
MKNADGGLTLRPLIVAMRAKSSGRTAAHLAGGESMFVVTPPCPAAGVESRTYTSFEIGNFRALLPVAEKVALQTAGATRGTPGSPIPP